jgi:hypothetical protein
LAYEDGGGCGGQQGCRNRYENAEKLHCYQRTWMQNVYDLISGSTSDCRK